MLASGQGPVLERVPIVHGQAIGREIDPHESRIAASATRNAKAVVTKFVISSKTIIRVPIFGRIIPTGLDFA